MTQEDKDLLLRDLCTRLPYNVKGCFVDECGAILNDPYLRNISLTYTMLVAVDGRDGRVLRGEVKPYLVPLSSMTEEQKKEISKRYNYYNPYQLCVLITNHRQGCWDNDDNSCDLRDYLWLEDWFNKNHFDYRGLIPKGLALDATGLDIY